MKFIKTPYLPESKVIHIIAGKGAEGCFGSFSELGIKLLYSQENTRISYPVASHSDLAVNYSGNGGFFLEKGQGNLKKELEEIGAKCNYISEAVKGEYPYDCFLNCILTDEYIICKKSAVSESILNYALTNGLKIINVNQGYTKCSVCPVERNAFITDDEGIYNALKIRKIDALKVEKGSIALKGCNYGFIGGCSGKISKNELAFCGDIKKHSNYNDIKAFTRNYNVDLVSLSNGELTDIGSLIPITQKEDENEKEKS